jgi:hypothetical protein
MGTTKSQTVPPQEIPEITHVRLPCLKPHLSVKEILERTLYWSETLKTWWRSTPVQAGPSWMSRSMNRPMPQEITDMRTMFVVDDVREYLTWDYDPTNGHSLENMDAIIQNIDRILKSSVTDEIQSKCIRSMHCIMYAIGVSRHKHDIHDHFPFTPVMETLMRALMYSHIFCNDMIIGTIPHAASEFAADILRNVIKNNTLSNRYFEKQYEKRLLSLLWILLGQTLCSFFAATLQAVTMKELSSHWNTP